MALLKESLNFLNFLPSHTRGQRFLAFTRPPDFWRCQVGTSVNNYSSDIWDFFRHIDLTAPLVKNPAYGPVNILEHASGTVIFSQIS